MRQATILVVDDDREIVGAIAKRLELDGHRVLRAYDGLEALDAVHSEAVDLIVLDVMMPSMDGLSATMAVRREKNVPILLLSAKSEDADKIAGPVSYTHLDVYKRQAPHSVPSAQPQ